MKQIKGILVYNASLQGEKFQQLHACYKESANRFGIALSLYSNLELCVGIQEGKLTLPPLEADFILFLDKDIILASLLEVAGYWVLNSSACIATCDDKRKTYQAMLGANIPMLDTIFAPLLFQPCNMERFNEQLIANFGLPLVLKAAFGSFGEQVHLVTSSDELLAYQQRYATIPHLYQRFQTSSIGRDVRMHVVGGRVIVSMERNNPLDFRANVTNGGSMQPFTPPANFQALALRVAEVLQADFLGIDLLFDEDGAPIVCEVNSNAHIVNILACTGVNVADAIFEMVRERMV
ncbi:MAG: RimK family alpha-L-glutamate ligase [Erysipelotrichaceae bacterium]